MGGPRTGRTLTSRTKLRNGRLLLGLRFSMPRAASAQDQSNAKPSVALNVFPHALGVKLGLSHSCLVLHREGLIGENQRISVLK